MVLPEWVEVKKNPISQVWAFPKEKPNRTISGLFVRKIYSGIAGTPEWAEVYRLRKIISNVQGILKIEYFGTCYKN